ncbi:MAG: hypothetical protein ACPLWC_02140 [Candidatus Woesearchaeota archaeon]
MGDLKDFYKEIKEGLDANQEICIETYTKIFNQFNKILRNAYSEKELKFPVEIERKSVEQISDLLFRAINSNRSTCDDFLRLEELIELEENLNKNKHEISSLRKAFNSALSIAALYTPLIIKSFYETVEKSATFVLESIFKNQSRIIDYSSSMIGSLTTFSGILGLSYLGSKILKSKDFVSGFYLNLALIGLSSAICLYSIYANELKSNYKKLRESVKITHSMCEKFGLFKQQYRECLIEQNEI